VRILGGDDGIEEEFDSVEVGGGGVDDAVVVDEIAANGPPNTVWVGFLVVGGRYNAEVCGFASRWNFGRVKEGHGVRTLGVVGDTSVTELGYLFRAAV